ncbi:MAG: transposase [Phycisphaeraceae bacterium]
MSAKHIIRCGTSTGRAYKGRRRFEHWYVDNQIYFITAKCREGFPAFADDAAKCVFWDRFDRYTEEAGFVPWLTSLLDNHYHTLGYLREGARLGRMMQRLHGSVAKLVNDTLDKRRTSFWSSTDKKDYFDGCIRDEKQCRSAYRYTLLQSVRHGIVDDWRKYPHTRMNVELERGVRRAKELGAFLGGVPYARYEQRGR